MNKGIMIGTICATLLTTNVFANFNDVNKNDRYYDAITYVKQSGIFNGESEDTFAPDRSMTRAMVVQVIYNIENKPEAKKAEYDDVKESEWYFDAISWATNEGIVKGMGDNKFEPNTLITKEQLVTVLYNYANYRKYDVSVGEDTNILSYEDAFSLHEYGYVPMQWACGAGIIKAENGLLNHNKAVTRAEVADIMKIFSQEYIKECGWIILEGNATTGYIWKASSYDNNIIFVDQYEYHQEESNDRLVGAPGLFEFKITALTPGKTEIVFEYMRSWEGKAVKTVVCEAEVDSNGRLDILLKSNE